MNKKKLPLRYFPQLETHYYGFIEFYRRVEGMVLIKAQGRFQDYE